MGYYVQILSESARQGLFFSFLQTFDGILEKLHM